jgi:ABC-type sugar transport system permease subunit
MTSSPKSYFDCVTTDYLRVQPGDRATLVVKGIDLLISKAGLGFTHSNWFTDQNFGIGAVTIAVAWQMSGYFLALDLAALRGIPGDSREAVKIDGTGFFGIYRYIMFPIAMPAFAVVLLWQFTSIWNDDLLGVVLSNSSLSPVTVAVTNLADSYFVE